MKTTNTVSKSWFCVFNNPQDHGFDGEPETIIDKIIEMWTKGNITRSCMVAFCISKDGLKHLHMVLEDTKAMRFSKIKKAFPDIHIAPTKGSKKEAEDYINKRGKYKKSGEQVILVKTHGEIHASASNDSILEEIEKLLDAKLTPNEIMSVKFEFRKYEKIIKDAYFQRRFDETPIKRDVTVYWHVGDSGSGKSYTFVQLCEQYGEDHVYMCNDFKAGMDKYNGEEILFLDEFRGQWSYDALLTALDGYRTQFHCRYTNIYSLWNEIHITSIMTPEMVYARMVSSHEQSIDPLQQLKRRISYIVYHYKLDGKYLTHTIPMGEYVDYTTLKSAIVFEDATEEQQLTIDEIFGDKKQKP